MYDLDRHERKLRYVYVTTNDTNGKTYVGQRTPSKGSIDQDRYLGSGVVLKKAIKKYGKQNFSKKILFKGIFTLEEICDVERYYIWLARAIGKAEYNVAKGGEGGCKRNDYVVSKETRKKISEGVKKGQTPEVRQRMREAKLGSKNPWFGRPGPATGYVWTDEQRKFQSKTHRGERNSMYGKNAFASKTDEEKKEIFERRRKTFAGKYSFAKKAVRCIDTGEVFESVTIAKAKYGGKIGSVCNGHTRSAHGMRWEWF